jgi:dTDP-4-amino-4,6-dideoxygalactose transaminase
MRRSNHSAVRTPPLIPFVDPITPNLELEEELLAIFRTSLRHGEFVGGSMVEAFEREFARYCDSEFCIGVGSGRDALRIALIAGGVSRGDIVLTVPNAFAATAEAIFQTGARPDFVDVDDLTSNMNWMKLEEHLETQCYRDSATGKLVDKRTQRPLTAIVPVHLCGQPADMDPILEIAEKYDLLVVEDARQAQGAEYFSSKESRWKRVGSIGHATAFGFNPGSNLSACGETGTVTTNDGGLAQRVRRLRDHGHAYDDFGGGGAGLDGVQAGILEAKLRHLVDWDKKRRENAFCYHGLLSPVVERITIPQEPSWARATYDSYVIRVDNRDELRTYLSAANIVTKIHCPVPLHLQDPYRALHHGLGRFPVAETIASETLSLPIYPQLKFDQQYRIAHTVTEFVTRRKENGPRFEPCSYSPDRFSPDEDCSKPLCLTFRSREAELNRGRPNRIANKSEPQMKDVS